MVWVSFTYSVCFIYCQIGKFALVRLLNQKNLGHGKDCQMFYSLKVRQKRPTFHNDLETKNLN